MALLILTSLLALLAPPSAGELAAADLVVQLGAPRQADREASGEALVGLGLAALPDLRKARESRDPEVRWRAGALVARIEAVEDLKAIPVRLDVRDAPLTEAVGAIDRESGMRVRPGDGAGTRRAAAQPPWPDGRVTLVADGPVPFWEAVDRLCEAGGLQRQYTPAEESFFPWKPPFQLTLLPGRARPPASDTGALRVELLRVRYDRDMDFGNDDRQFSPFAPAAAGRRDPNTGVAVGSSYRADLLVSAEPRLRIFGGGRVEDVEAVDDRGRSLVKTPTDEEGRRQVEVLRMNPHIDPALHPELRYGTSGTSMRWYNVSIPLAYPSPRARRIATLRGVIPVAVLARRPGPLEVDLKGAMGKTFGTGPTRITVHEVAARPGAEPTVALTLETPPDGPGETVAVCDPKGARFRVRRPADLLELRLEVLDGRGEPLFWQFTSAPTERTRGRMTIIVHRRNNEEEVEAEGLRLRYWETAGAVTGLPFSFNDVPTP